jgi:hypothetical protein
MIDGAARHRRARCNAAIVCPLVDLFACFAANRWHLRIRVAFWHPRAIDAT